MEISPMPQGFGAEVSGLALADGCDAATVTRLQQAFAEHQLLVFRGAVRLTPERQAEIASWFGPVGLDGQASGKPWTFMDNADPTGRLELQFHSDISYMEHPIEGISLHALDLPRVPTSTTYVSNICAWNALPEDLRARLRGKRGRHFFGDGRMMNMDWPPFEHWHPVCQVHAPTGREMLYVTEHHVTQIEGLGADDSAAVLNDLFAALYAAERRYEHVWQVGDLVVWDNMAVQHARTRVADPADGPRLLQRVSFGRHGFMQQLEALQRKLADQPAA